MNVTHISKMTASFESIFFRLIAVNLNCLSCRVCFSFSLSRSPLHISLIIIDYISAIIVAILVYDTYIVLENEYSGTRMSENRDVENYTKES